MPLHPITNQELLTSLPAELRAQVNGCITGMQEVMRQHGPASLFALGILGQELRTLEATERLLGFVGSGESTETP